MLAEVDIYGVYVPGLLALMLAAFAATLVVRRVLGLVGAYAFVWHRSLFDLALFVVLLQALTVLSRWVLS